MGQGCDQLPRRPHGGGAPTPVVRHHHLRLLRRDLSLVSLLPLFEADGRKLLPEALRPRFPLPPLERRPGHRRHVQVVLHEGPETQVRPLDLLGKIRLPGRLLGNVRHRPVRTHALAAPVLREIPPGLAVQYRHHRPFR